MPREQLPVDIPLLIQAGVGHHRAGRFPEAESIYHQILRADPENAHALHLLGAIAHQVGKDEIAVRLIERAIGYRPSEASFLNSLGEAYRGLGRLGEALECYGKALAIQRDMPEALYNRGSALHALGRYEEALDDCERTLAVRPEYVEAWNNRGAAQQGLKRYEEALASFDRALMIRPDYVAAWSNRGNTMNALGRHDDALACCDQALAIQADFVDALSNRGAALQELSRHEEALASFDRALAIEPGHVEALSNRGGALHALGRYGEACAIFERAIAIKPDCAKAHNNHSLCRLLTGDFEQGWKQHEWRWKCDDFPSPKRDFAQPLWLGKEDLSGKSIVLHAEQGLGDTIQFVRYAPLVAARGANVLLEVPGILLPLVAGLAGPSRVVARGEALPATDFHTPLLSLPLAFQTTLQSIPASIPYLSAEGAAASAWRMKLTGEGQRLVGLCWKGNPGYKRDRERSIAFASFARLLSAPGVRFISLQKELDESERELTAKATNFTHPGADFRSTAELIAALDLVITVDTVWAHWAGAIGKPVWVLLPYVPHWCWMLERQDSPWYSSARLFRQTRIGDWDGVIDKVMRQIRG